MTGNLILNSNILPHADVYHTVGSQAKRFSEIYGYSIYANTINPIIVGQTKMSFNTSLNPLINDTYSLGEIGPPPFKWKNLALSGNLTIDGTVDGVDVSSHAGNADAHHPSGNVKDYTLGLKTGIKAGTGIGITDDGGYAKIAASGGSSTPSKRMIRFTEFGGTGDYRIGGDGYNANYEFALTFCTTASGDFADLFEDLALAAQANLFTTIEFETAGGGWYGLDNSQRYFLLFNNSSYNQLMDSPTYDDANYADYAGFWLVIDSTYNHRLLAITSNENDGMKITDCGAITIDGSYSCVFSIKFNFSGGVLQNVEFYKNGILLIQHTDYLPNLYPIHAKLGISNQAGTSENMVFKYLSVHEYI